MEMLKKIEFTPAQQALLGILCDQWTRAARQLQSDAKVVENETEKRRLESRATSYLRNASDLRDEFMKGELPATLGFQVRVVEKLGT